MIIKDMFKDDINRNINGVVQVTNLDETDVIEYVITKELRRHFIDFFNNYNDAFTQPTNDIGVWISGFFGSGKSHFLKMLSYILENKTINGVSTVERFREKFDDPATFMLIDQATKNETETILFNIGTVAADKAKTVVKRIFAKMFYNHLGFYGEDLKVARLEKFIDKKGKTDEFRRVFEEKNGESWADHRDDFEFFEDDMISTLTDVLGMSETAARNWFNGTEKADISIEQLISEIKEYVDSKPDNFRLIFMADEVGQYIGDDGNLLYDLQTIEEKLGSVCRGKVWVICTGQEAVDEIINMNKVRMDNFSKIQARFKTRLSLSSSAVDEVIQKRLLKKTQEAEKTLSSVYEKNDTVLKNLFTFKDSRLDMKGFANDIEFTENYPFVPYQFILIQKIFSEIRKHGAVGKNYSGAERSMLDGFQIVLKSMQDKDENAVAPLYPFYDSVHKFLDGSIRRVIERCQSAAENGDGIESYDVKVLKLLYLLRYIDNDMPANLNNIVILMADEIGTDKIALRQKVQDSLDRLKSQNYIDCRSDIYLFLTDEEQDIAKDIYVNTTVDTPKIVERIGKIIFGDIYKAKKFKYGKYDFPFDKMVDGTAIGSYTGDMKLRFLTIASDEQEKSNSCLMNASGDEVIVVLSETSYFESLVNAEKIYKYVKQKDVNQLPKAVQDIIHGHQDEAKKYEKIANEELEKAIIGAKFYLAGDKLEIRESSAVSMIDKAMSYLAKRVYSKLSKIREHAECDNDIIRCLNGKTIGVDGADSNQEAADEIERFLESNQKKNLSTTMDDVQNRYHEKPYGWKEIDIAFVVALLIYQNKVTIKYNGVPIYADDASLPDKLRKKNERSKTTISKKQSITVSKLRNAREIMREYFDIMDVPEDEEGLVDRIISNFKDKYEHYKSLKVRYENHKYPDEAKVSDAVSLMEEILSQHKDNFALIDKLISCKDRLYDSKDSMQRVEDFFANQVGVYDAAFKMVSDLKDDDKYLEVNEKVHYAMDQIHQIMTVQDSESVYRRIPELNVLMSDVADGHDAMLSDKRNEALDVVDNCLSGIRKKAESLPQSINTVNDAVDFYEWSKDEIAGKKNIALLDAVIHQMWERYDKFISELEEASKPVKPSETKSYDKPPVKKNIKSIYRRQVFNPKVLETQEDIDNYINEIRSCLTELLKKYDGIKLN